MAAGRYDAFDYLTVIEKSFRLFSRSPNFRISEFPPREWCQGYAGYRRGSSPRRSVGHTSCTNFSLSAALSPYPTVTAGECVMMRDAREISREYVPGV